MPIIAIYAAILALLFVVLSVRVIRLRRGLGVAIGDADNMAIKRAMLVQANFAEYVPFALLLIYFVELSGVAHWLVHLLGLMLLAGRFSHAIGVSKTNENLRFRVTGMMLTFSTLIISSLTLLISAIFR